MYKTIILSTLLLSITIDESKAQTNNNMENNKFSAEQIQVLGTIEEMVTAFHNKDIDGVMACYEQSATVVFEPEKPITKRSDIIAAFQEAFAINPNYRFKGHEVFITGDIATHFTPWTMSGQLPDGTKIEQSGLSVAVLRKQSDGKWLMIFDNPHGQFLME